MSTLEIPKRFFFRFSLKCGYLTRLWSPNDAAGLDESFKLPDLSELELQPTSSRTGSPIDFRIAWNEKGLSFSVIVSGKQRNPWCRLTHPEESDGIQICIDTKDVHNVHRATRFCHRLAFLPLGNGADDQEPLVVWFPIHRAKGHPNTVAVDKISVKSTVTKNEYRLDATIPGDVLTGYDPSEFPQIGFHYFVVDQEIGNHPMLVGPPFPHDNDPSLWGTLELTK